jgi:hypothetical protein
LETVSSFKTEGAGCLRRTSTGSTISGCVFNCQWLKESQPDVFWDSDIRPQRNPLKSAVRLKHYLGTKAVGQVRQSSYVARHHFPKAQSAPISGQAGLLGLTEEITKWKSYNTNRKARSVQKCFFILAPTR